MKRSDPAAVRYELPSRFEVIEQMVDEAQTYFGAHVTDEDVLYRIVLLACEATTNAIEHGNRLDPSLKVDVRFAIEGPLARIVVEDEGDGFDPDAVQDPLEPENLLGARGRGVFLINELADRVEWDKGGSRLNISVDLPQD